MKEEVLVNAIKQYFITMAEYGRTVSKEIKPEEAVIKKEKKFLKYLDDNDLVCWFCYEHLIVLQIDYKTQRPSWGCLKDKAIKGLQKIKWADHCGDCGKKLNLDEEQLANQKKYMDNGQSATVCDKCIGNGNILTEEDMKDVKVKKLSN